MHLVAQLCLQCTQISQWSWSSLCQVWTITKAFLSIFHPETLWNIIYRFYCTVAHKQILTNLTELTNLQHRFLIQVHREITIKVIKCSLAIPREFSRVSLSHFYSMSCSKIIMTPVCNDIHKTVRQDKHSSMKRRQIKIISVKVVLGEVIIIY